MFTLIVSGISLALVLMGAFATRRWIPEWWAKKWVRVFAYIWIGLTLASVAAVLIGIATGSFYLYQAGKYGWASSIVVTLPLFPALFFSIVALGIHTRRQKKRNLGDMEAARGRRRFLKVALLAPALSTAASFGGLIGAHIGPSLRELEIQIPGLAPGLDGLRILQITDAHLGPFVGLESIDETLEAMEGQRADIIAVTGDFADHLRLFKPAIERLESLKPRHGVFFTMGNHEYYHPPEKVADRIERAGVRALVGEGTTLKINGATLYLAGADDPARTGEDEDPFLLASVEKALKDQPSGAFTLLLSHRPRGFTPAQRFGVDLTLAGHTHGYQIGAFGHSIAEPLLPGSYPRGHYQEGASQLYTSTGFGHWFPFRLGCNREAPMIVLRRV